ncbi:plasmid mobilization relaxosome protein MobC [Pedobacter sp. KR3-3]|uniref:Plasmid mobilization relaxosome protein MobC n=1 Tax=Pedobacter albus TaxID=3113905 RepID=A0ABU7ICT3_9SPHI|nr:plasmid mobilization relaxosome protein MobC [Pedobacter sp. KR3-3]MEE1947251.1 plasmid mobilization relaxosome protein MobC [Pedobacter sp. KR3-3]
MERADKKNQSLPCRIHTRLTQEKYDELSRVLKQTRTIRSLSELLRYILDNKVITVKVYDASMDKIMEELAGLQKELQAIGININQVAHALHRLNLPGDKLSQANEIITCCEATQHKISELFLLMTRLFDKWLPE